MRFGAVVAIVTACASANSARAEDDAGTSAAASTAPALPTVVDDSLLATPPAPALDTTSSYPLQGLDGIPPVPNPSSVVLAGRPTGAGSTGKPLEWHWSRSGTLDLIITGVGGATTLAMAIIPPRGAHVSGPILFDEAARDALRAHSLQARYMFRDASDVGLSLVVTWPFFADALASAWWFRGSRDVAEEMALVNLQTLAISGALQGMANVLVSRERPYGRSCGSAALPSAAIDCEGTTHYRSFFSGHSAFSFTSAALICMDHVKHDLLGGPWDVLSCVGGYAVAATTATFRIVADVHYASDVLAGALIGTLVGYGVPLLHYHHVEIGTVRAGNVRMQIVPSAFGLGAVGSF